MEQLSETATQWLEARGLDIELAAKMGWSSNGQNGGEALVIPFVKGGEIVNRKHRGLAEKRFHQDKGGEKCFWNYDAITDASLADQPLIITEGEIDALTAIQCGFVRTVSVPDGAPAIEVGADDSGAKYSYVLDAMHDLSSVKIIIVATDADQAGKALFNDLAIRLGKPRVKHIRYPRGCKDLNEAFEAFGEKGVSKSIATAEFCSVGGVFKASDLPPYPRRRAYSTGMHWLDSHYRMRRGDFCVITGVPGHGKSTFANDLLCSAVDENGFKVAFASFEQHPQADHIPALRNWKNGGADEHMSNAEIQQANEWIDNNFLFIVPDSDDNANLKWTLDRCAVAVIQHDVDIVIIDPWNELDHDKPSNVSLTEYTGFAIKEFKRFARRFDVHVIVVAHPTKMPGGEKPTLYSISDSAHWANKADIGIVIWKPDFESNFAEISINKSRYHEEIGRPGIVRVEFSPVTKKFSKVEFQEKETENAETE